jgi:hypothetical protein
VAQELGQLFVLFTRRLVVAVYFHAEFRHTISLILLEKCSRNPVSVCDSQAQFHFRNNVNIVVDGANIKSIIQRRVRQLAFS